MCVMEEEIKSIQGLMTEKFKVLQDSVQELVQKSVQNQARGVDVSAPERPSYANIARNEKSVLVIKKRATGETANMEDVQTIAENTGSAVTNAYKNSSGDAIIVCESKDSVEKMRPALVESMTDFTVVSPPARRPTVNISEINRNYSKDELFKVIKAQNINRGIEITEDNFNILFIKPHAKNNSLYMAVIRVSDAIRDAIKHAGDKVCIGSIACPVFDRFFVRRCNKCQGLNHWKDECKADKPVCGRCSGEHETRDCSSTTRKCSNCTAAGISENNHETSWVKCKTYISAQNKFKSTINYYNTLN